MNTDTMQLTTTAPTGSVEQRGSELEVTAFTPEEMKHANEALILWCERKIASMKAEAKDLFDAFTQAVEKKWKSSTLKRHSELATKRVTFYEKLKAALEQGFYIVPNFPVDLFAIRTDREKPFRKLQIGSYKASAWPFQQPPALLPVGEGENKTVNPLVSCDVETIMDDKGNTKTKYYEEATGWGEIDFPIKMAKPQIMEATGRAMALKIFDQFGLFANGTGDPIIVGEIVDPTRKWSIQHSKRITFIIAWHLDTKGL